MDLVVGERGIWEARVGVGVLRVDVVLPTERGFPYCKVCKGRFSVIRSVQICLFRSRQIHILLLISRDPSAIFSAVLRPSSLVSPAALPPRLLLAAHAIQDKGAIPGVSAVITVKDGCRGPPLHSLRTVSVDGMECAGETKVVGTLQTEVVQRGWIEPGWVRPSVIGW